MSHFPAKYKEPYLPNEFEWSSPWLFNSSVPIEPWTFPYNSSIRFNGTTHNLSAPLLHFEYDSKITWPLACYEETPGPASPTSYCVAGDGFVWGFSRTLLKVGLSVEVAWIILLYIIWLNAQYRSSLLRRGVDLGTLHRGMVNLVQVSPYLGKLPICSRKLPAIQYNIRAQNFGQRCQAR